MENEDAEEDSFLSKNREKAPKKRNGFLEASGSDKLIHSKSIHNES